MTSSPYHIRFNGKAESAVQEAKKLRKKYSYHTLDSCSALLEWWNSPRDQLLKSRGQRLMGRQTQTLLLVPDCCLEPAIVEPSKVRSQLQVICNKQRTYYNKTRALPELHEGQQVSTFDSVAHTWSPTVVVKRAGPPRSYGIETDDGRVLTRTRERLRASPLQPEPVIPIFGSPELPRQQTTPVPTREAPTKETPSQDPQEKFKAAAEPQQIPKGRTLTIHAQEEVRS